MTEKTENLVINLRSIKKRYDDEAGVLNALRGIDLTVKKGDFLAIMGPSGSGKSTLMNIIGLLDRPSRGNYFLDGIDTSKLGDNQLSKLRRDKIGFIFQTFNLLPRLNILQNVELPMVYRGISLKKRKLKATKILKSLGLEDKIKSRTNRLSGGQIQRAAIARSLVNDPSLILADEPSGNLDSKTSDEVMKILVRLNKTGTTIVMVTHSSEIAAYASRSVRVKDGKIS
ncbi:MAG: ABC transporter ATP-binding protein [bacterium]|nr:ABC transporter ATP-binding protein [bacterium]